MARRKILIESRVERGRRRTGPRKGRGRSTLNHVPFQEPIDSVGPSAAIIAKHVLNYAQARRGFARGCSLSGRGEGEGEGAGP